MKNLVQIFVILKKLVNIELQRIIQSEFNFPGNFFLLYVDKTYEGTLDIKRIFLMNF